MSFNDITTVEQLNELNSDDMVRGYRAGYSNTPNFTEKDRAYWHGYMNGQVDGGHMQSSRTQQELARAYVRSLRVS